MPEIAMKTKKLLMASAFVAAVSLANIPFLMAADHAESPIVESDQGADIADLYAFLDPNDPSRTILAFDVHGFIVPGENSNLAAFDPDVRFSFSIENTGDAKTDKTIDVSFSRPTGRGVPQLAEVVIPGKRKKDDIRFYAPSTPGSATDKEAKPPTLTLDPATGIIFFAGLRDDPFFFDIPAFNRFQSSVLSGKANTSHLKRGRNTFAGYNIQMIALSVPNDLLTGSAGSKIGVSSRTYRRAITRLSSKSDPKLAGGWVPIDRMAVPAINTVVVSFPLKDTYNRATEEEDARLRFGVEIIGNLKKLGTDESHIATLAEIAVRQGDYLRLDTAIPNLGNGGGRNPGAGFPNGRRPGDDVIDTILTLVANGQPLGDSVDNNDLEFLNTFPFFSAPHQPRDPNSDDLTQN